MVSVSYSFSFKRIDGLPPGANYTIQTIAEHPVTYALSINFPPGTQSFNIDVVGEDYGNTFAFRGSDTISYAQVTMNASPYNPQSYQVLIPTSPRFEIRTW